MYVCTGLTCPPPRRQMLSYACVAEFFSQPDSPAYLTFLAENLEGDTNALQVFLGEGGGRVHCIRNMKCGNGYIYFNVSLCVCVCV